MKKMTNTLLASTLLLGLFGCASAPEKVNYYLLSGAKATVQQEKQPESLILLDNIQLPDYLKQQYIVMQLNENQLQFSNQHQWAERLEMSMEKVLLSELNQASDKQLFLSYKQDKQAEAKGRLDIAVEHFLITDKSQVVLSGEFFVHRDKEVKRVPFLLKKDLTSDGYPHAISQMRQLVADLALKIAEKI